MAVAAANKRLALVIATSQYEDSDLKQLIAPAQDATALTNVLKDPNIGSFDVKIILNEPHYKITREVENFLRNTERKDLVLLYFSCHGIKDKDGNLYFAAKNTNRNLLDSTAISANFINDLMRKTRSRHQILLLDCCFSGAFAKGMTAKTADKQVHIKDYFDMERSSIEERGRVVLTASDAMQYSFEGDERKGVSDYSIFTKAIVEGLETGRADGNNDGHVSYNELYDYAYDSIVNATSLQRPEMWVFGVQGNILIAKNPYKNKIQEKSTDEQDPNDLILDAAENLKRGDYNSTIAYSDKAIKINPRSAVAYNTKGSALFNLRQYQEALVCYEKALELRPKYIEAINNKGLALSLTGKYDKAIECFNQSTDLNPNDPVIWNYKGVALHALGKYEDAIASYDKAINLRSNYVEALNNRGFSYSHLKKTEEQSPQHPEVEVAKEVKQPFTPPSAAPVTQPSPHQASAAPVTQPQPSSSDFSTIERKKPQWNNLKILIPVITAVVIGAIIISVVFGIHQQAQQPPSSQTPVSQPPTITTNQTPVSQPPTITTNQTPVSQPPTLEDKALQQQVIQTQQNWRNFNNIQNKLNPPAPTTSNTCHGNVRVGFQC